MKPTEYAIRLFLASIALQLAFLYIDIFDVLPNLRDGPRYVFHILSHYLTPLALGVGIVLHLIDYISALIARKK